jgi:hypothetical protein
MQVLPDLVSRSTQLVLEQTDVYNVSVLVDNCYRALSIIATGCLKLTLSVCLDVSVQLD